MMSEAITRQTIEPSATGLQTGYGEPPSGFHIPSCGIEDVDQAVFMLFDKHLSLSTQTTVKGGAATRGLELTKPVVVFATGERFALAKRLKPIRDKNGSLLLPAISIRRTSIEQTYADMASRGINQTTGELVIKRRLFESMDRGFQNLLNKEGLLNLPPLVPTSTRPEVGTNKNDSSILEGMLLDPSINKHNVFEIICIPQPQFYTATYEVVLWSSYTEHMNYMIETILSSQLPQLKAFKLVTDKGYWFLAKLEESVASQGNIDNFTDEERLVRYSFTLKVPSFLVVGSGPGQRVPVRRWISAVNIAFDSYDGQVEVVVPERNEQREANPFVLTNVDEDLVGSKRSTTMQQFLLYREDRTASGHLRKRFVKIMDKNNKRQGETTYTASDKEILEEYLTGITNH